MSITNSTQFHGLDDEDAPGYLSLFVRICGTFRINDVSEEAVYLRLFPFTLAGRAATWLNLLPKDSITTWADLQTKFLKKYYPPSKSARLRSYPFCEAMFEDFALVEYEDLSFVRRAAPAVKPTVAPPIPTRGMHHVTPNTSTAAALEALAKDIKELNMAAARYEICRGGHTTAECPITDQAQVEAINSGWNSSYEKPPTRQIPITERDAPEISGSRDRDIKLEDMMAQQMKMLQQIMDKDKLLTTCSGRGGEVELPPPAIPDDDESVDEEIELETPVGVPLRLDPASTSPSSESSVERLKREKVEEKKKGKRVAEEREVDLTKLPYPAHVLQLKRDQEYGHFLEMFKQLKINLPFVEALQHMPKYDKFLKDLLSNKKKLETLFTVTLGASTNLMPYSFNKQLDLGEPTPTRMSQALADRLVKYPRGIIENVLVKVDKFVFPVDFVILDMQADDRGKISLRVGDDTVTFDVVKSMKNSSGQDDQVYFLHAFFSTMDRCLAYISGVDMLGDQDLGDGDERVDDVGDKVHAAAIEAYLDYIPNSLAVEPHVYPMVFEYTFLDGDYDLPVIISAALTDVEKSRLISVLREHKQAIAWKLMDIKGIHPSFCTHRILLEEDFKPVV
ncbi:hypothetical protein E3N88_25717 [Mikania micrantha]|uniref:Retrotransposon gag domain-containing protein n=1 Tax=Mikania micrantha TaxID=192012 RepID=A0A5N6N5J1_9ASTR|nr:hypothetical protein E3N88_25717 [Mikania micrantha]